MLGRLLEVTGGAQVLADTLVSRFGEKRAPLALGVAALLFGFPIFFDAGLVVFLPIIFTVARRFGGSVLLYALPAAGAFAAMHAIVPAAPRSGRRGTSSSAPTSASMLLVNLPVAVIAWYVGVYLVSRLIGRRVTSTSPTCSSARPRAPTADPAPAGPRRTTTAPRSHGRRHRHRRRRRADRHAGRGAVVRPGARLLLLPLVLIAINTILTTLRASGTVDGDGPLRRRPDPARQHPGRAAHHAAGRDRRCWAPATAASLAETTTLLNDSLGPDLLDHPDHRRRRHVRRRAAQQRDR